MKEIIYNYDNLDEKDIDEKVIRSKALIINSNDEIILGYSYKTYQFPGGHIEKHETPEECVRREIKEETGIIVKENLEPFMVLKTYLKNYRDTDINRENDIYYYIYKTDDTIDLSNTNYDHLEQLGHYEIVRVRLDEIEELLIESIPDNPVNKYIVDEMLEVLKEYKKRFRLEENKIEEIL